MASAKSVLCVGDIHFQNYGTWRDVDGRLAWGVNDYDEAAKMTFVLVLVRLARSTLLGRGRHSITDDGMTVVRFFGAVELSI